MKKITGLLLEIIYSLLTILLLCVFALKNVTSEINDIYLLIGLALFAIGISVVFGPIIGKVVNSCFLILLFSYITSQLNNPYFRLTDGKTFTNIPVFWVIIVVGINVLFLVLYLLLLRHQIRIKFYYRYLGIVLFVGAALFSNIYSNGIRKDTEKGFFDLINSDYYKYEHIEDSDVFVKRFGLLAFLDKDIKDTIDECQNRKDYTKEINDFINRDKTININNYSNIFEGDSVLFIQSDSLYDCFISETLTPNIYKYKNTGIDVDGFDNLSMFFKDSDVEIMSNLSLFPIGGDDCYSYLYDRNYYGESLGNMFKRGGYDTYFYMNDFDIYYNRQNMTKVYGYDELLSPYKFGKDPICSNYDVIETASYILFEDRKEMAYYTAHDIVGVDEETRNRILSVYPYATDLEITKIANLIDLDRSLPLLETVLGYTGMDNKTVIVLFGSGVDNRDDFKDFVSNVGINANTGLYIYKKGIEGTQYTKKGSCLDFIPTFGNMFGLEYDNTYIIGRDLFDDNYAGMQLSSYYGLSEHWYNNYIDYNYIHVGLSTAEGYENAQADIEDMMQRVRFSYNWFKYSNYYLKNS